VGPPKNRSSALRSSSIWVGLVLLVLVPATVSASGSSRTVGVAAGEQVVYSYHVHNSYINDTTDQNVTTDTYWNLTIDIQSVSTNSSLPDLGYHITEDSISDGTVVGTYSESNLTTLFDPFDIGTYLGNLGFPAFIFTDVQNGTKNFGYNVPTTSLPPWATSNSTEVPQNITVAVVRTPASIYVSLRDVLLKSSSPFMIAAVTYSATTGVMESSAMYTLLSGVYKNFFYTLLSFGQHSAHNYTYLWYVALGAVAAVVVVVGVIRRPSQRQKKVDKMRKG